jgi:hypothetical protein
VRRITDGGAPKLIKLKVTQMARANGSTKRSGMAEVISMTNLGGMAIPAHGLGDLRKISAGSLTMGAGRTITWIGRGNVTIALGTGRCVGMALPQAFQFQRKQGISRLGAFRKWKVLGMQLRMAQEPLIRIQRVQLQSRSL